MRVTLEKGEVLDIALVENDRIIGNLSLKLSGLAGGGRTVSAAASRTASAPAASEQPVAKTGRRKRRQLSAESRARMAEAQRLRREKERGKGRKKG